MAPVRPMRSPGRRRCSSATSGWGDGSKPVGLGRAARSGPGRPRARGPRPGPTPRPRPRRPVRGGAGWPARPASRWPATTRRRPAACCGPPPDRGRAGRGRRRCGFLGLFPDDTHAQVPETGSNPDPRAADVVEPGVVVPPALGRAAGRRARRWRPRRSSRWSSRRSVRRALLLGAPGDLRRARAALRGRPPRAAVAPAAPRLDRGELGRLRGGRGRAGRLDVGPPERPGQPQHPGPRRGSRTGPTGSRSPATRRSAGGPAGSTTCPSAHLYAGGPGADRSHGLVRGVRALRRPAGRGPLERSARARRAGVEHRPDRLTVSYQDGRRRRLLEHRRAGGRRRPARSSSGPSTARTVRAGTHAAVRDERAPVS